MPRSSEIQTGQFVAQGDDGKRYTVIEWTTVIPGSSLSGQSFTHGARRYRLLGSNTRVDRLDERTFQITQTDVVLRKI